MLPTLAGLVTAGFVFARLGALLMTMPAFGAKGVPTLARLAAALLLTVIVASVLDPVPEPPSVGLFAAGMFREVLLGGLIGLAVRFAFSAVSIGGELLSMQMGHGAANLFDPMLDSTQGPLGTLTGLLASALFLGLDLHLRLIEGLAASFLVVAPGGAVEAGLGAPHLLRLASLAYATAVRVAAPIVLIVFLNNLFVAVITRLAPSMNVFFSLGFILSLVLGHGMFFAALPTMLDTVMHEVTEVVAATPDLVWDLAGGDRGR